MDPCRNASLALSISNEALQAINASYVDLLALYETATAPSPDPCAYSAPSAYSQPLHVGAIFIVLVCSFLGAAIPLLGAHHKLIALPPFAIVLGKCMGTGVVLACGLIHMLQPSNQSLTNSCLPWEFTTDYPNYAYLFAMLAGLGMHLTEDILQSFVVGRGDAETPAPLSDGAAPKPAALATDVGAETSRDDTPGPSTPSVAEALVSAAPLGLGNTGATLLPSTASSAASPPTVGPTPIVTGFGGVAPRSPAFGDAAVYRDALTAIVHVHSHAGGLTHTSKASSANHLRFVVAALLMEFGVGVHSVFIGLAVGVLSDGDLTSLLVALCFHQFFEGVALGSRLVDATFSSLKTEAAFVAAFAVAAPAGMAVGTGLVFSGALNPGGVTFLLVQGSFDGVCGGILLYLGYALLTHDFPEDALVHCGPGSIARPGSSPRQWRRRTLMYVSLWIGAGFMAFIGKYL